MKKFSREVLMNFCVLCVMSGEWPVTYGRVVIVYCVDNEVICVFLFSRISNRFIREEALFFLCLMW